VIAPETFNLKKPAAHEIKNLKFKKAGKS